jgi:hypothetical protein
MLFQRINRSDAETVFSIFYNVAGGTITAGYPAVWDVGTPDGVRVTQPATETLSLLIGIATQDIADSAYGKFQVYGYKASAYVTNATSVTVTAGHILTPVAGAWYLTKSATGTGKDGLIYAGETYACNTSVTAGANKKVFIRCL